MHRLSKPQKNPFLIGVISNDLTRFGCINNNPDMHYAHSCCSALSSRGLSCSLQGKVWAFVWDLTMRAQEHEGRDFLTSRFSA